jgi:hypothetical protein
MDIPSVNLDVLYAVSVERVLVQRFEEAADAVDGRETEAILSEQWTTIGFVVDATTRLKDVDSKLRSYPILRSRTSNDGV